jgi:hypothetical protein
MTPTVSDEPRIERMIVMAERLIVALEADIAALKSGKLAGMRSMDPEIQKLSVIYGREAQNFDIRIAKAAKVELRTRFLTVTGKFREVLQLHARVLTRVKNASEGMIQAIAKEVERMNAPMRTYGATPPARPVSSGAMVFNRVVLFPLPPSHATAAGGLRATGTSPVRRLRLHEGGGPAFALLGDSADRTPLFQNSESIPFELLGALD